MDISAAFLNAELDPKHIMVIRPPGVMVKMGLIGPDDRWVIMKAMYGLRESPRLWEESRDAFLSTLSWDHVDAHKNTTPMKLRQSKVHPSLWYIISATSEERDVQRLQPCPIVDGQWADTHEWTSALDVRGQLLVYVDDLFCASLDRKINDSFFEAIRTHYKCSPPEHLDASTPSSMVMRFLGMNLQRIHQDDATIEVPAGSFVISQNDYILGT
eukprot:227163-Amphidinium_carterae.1